MTQPVQPPFQPRLAPGDSAPSVTVYTSDGAAVSLASLWRGGPLVLEFLRHFG